MKIERVDHIGIVVNDLSAAKNFFLDLGFELQGETSVEGEWADRVNGLKDTKADIVMLQAPNNQISLELTKLHSPKTIGEQNLPSNALGFRHIAFIVDDIDATVAMLADKGIKTVAELVNYQNVFKLCYVSGPEGIIVELAEKVG